MPARPRTSLPPHPAARAPSSVPGRKPLGLSWSLLPYADFVARGIAQRRDPEIAFRIRRLDHDAARRLHFLDHRVEPMHVDVEHRSRIRGDGAAGDESADHVAGRVGEAQMTGAAAANLPPEDVAIKRGRRLHVLGGNLDVGETAVSE